MMENNALPQSDVTPSRPFEWELDEVQRASLRQQRATTPYPSQMNGLKDNFEDYVHQPEVPPPDQNKPTT